MQTQEQRPPSQPATLAAALLGFLLIGAPAAAIGQEPNEQERGTAERVGAQFDRFLERLQRNFRDLSDDVRRRAAEVQERVEDLGVEARVYSRIRWDKALGDAEIAIEAKEGGVVILHGRVADAELRRKAVRLAVETIGVERVQDNLTIGNAPPSTEEPTPTIDPH